MNPLLDVTGAERASLATGKPPRRAEASNPPILYQVQGRYASQRQVVGLYRCDDAPNVKRGGPYGPPRQ